MKKNSMVLLGFLLVINIALGHSSAADHILGQKVNQNELETTRINSMFTQKETSEGRGTHYHVRKLGFGGKKSMVIHKESSMVFSMKEKGSEGGGTPKMSGATYSDGICDFEREGADDDDAFKKSIGSLREGEDQKDEKTIGSDLSNTNSQVKTRLITTFRRHERQVSEEPRAHKGTTPQKVEEKTKRISQPEEEVMNLIHMDYKGLARRKPPINNQEPRN